MYSAMERKTESGELIWRGPRMRIAMHSGATQTEHDHLRGCVVYVSLIYFHFYVFSFNYCYFNTINTI